MERQEFEQLALEHLDAVYRMALQLARNPDLASDLTQETYLRALRSARTFEQKGAGMRAWLFTILHNTFYTHIKRESRAPVGVDHFSETDDRETIPSEPPPTWDLRTLDWDHVDQRLKRAIDDLTPEHREVLLLWGVEGLRYRQIADVLGVPIGTVMSRLHRARKTLAESLEELPADLGWRIGTTPESP